MKELSRTGLDALDFFLGGGLPRGFTTVVLAPSGAGAEIFAKQFASGARPDEAVRYFTTDEPRDEVLYEAEGSGYDYSNVQVVDIGGEFARAMRSMHKRGALRPTAMGFDSGPRKFDARKLVRETRSEDILRRAPSTRKGVQDKEDMDTAFLERLLDESKEEVPRTVINSLDFFFGLYAPEPVLQVLNIMKAMNSAAGGQLLLILSKDAHGHDIERRVELLADCLLELEMERKGTNFERYFMVKKIRNRAQGIGVSTYEITREGFRMETLERIV